MIKWCSRKIRHCQVHGCEYSAQKYVCKHANTSWSYNFKTTCAKSFQSRNLIKMCNMPYTSKNSMQHILIYSLHSKSPLKYLNSGFLNNSSFWYSFSSEASNLGSDSRETAKSWRKNHFSNSSYFRYLPNLISQLVGIFQIIICIHFETSPEVEQSKEHMK